MGISCLPVILICRETDKLAKVPLIFFSVRRYLKQGFMASDNQDGYLKILLLIHHYFSLLGLAIA